MKKLLFILLVLLTASAVLASQYNIAILYDYSGSMKKNDKSNKRKDIINYISKELGSMANIGFAKFSTTPDKVFTGISDPLTREKKLNEFFSGIKDNGKWTDIDKAVSMGVNIINNQSGDEKIILLFTDGLDDYKGFNANTMKKMLENSGIKLNIIKFGKKSASKAFRQFIAKYKEFVRLTNETKPSVLVSSIFENIDEIRDKNKFVGSVAQDDLLLFNDFLQILPGSSMESSFFVPELAYGLEIKFDFPLGSDIYFEMTTPNGELISESTFSTFEIIYNYYNNILDIYIPSPEIGTYRFSFRSNQEGTPGYARLDKIPFVVKLDNRTPQFAGSKIYVENEGKKIFINDKYYSDNLHTAFYPSGLIYNIKMADDAGNEIIREFKLGNYSKVILYP